MTPPRDFILPNSGRRDIEYYVALIEIPHMSFEMLRDMQLMIQHIKHPSISLQISPNGILVSGVVTVRDEDVAINALRELRSILNQAYDQFQKDQLVHPRRSLSSDMAGKIIFDRVNQPVCKKDFSILTSPVKVFCDNAGLRTIIENSIGGPFLIKATPPLSFSARSLPIVEREIVEDNASTSAVTFSKPLGLCCSMDEAIARSVAVWILAGHPESRLSSSLRKVQSLSYNPIGSLQWISGLQWFTFSAMSITASSAQLSESTLSALHEHQTRSVTSREIQRAFRLMDLQTRENMNEPAAIPFLESSTYDGSDPYGLSLKLYRRQLAPPSPELVNQAYHEIVDPESFHRVSIQPRMK